MGRSRRLNKKLAKAAVSCKRRQKGEKSVRELRAELGEMTGLLATMAASRLLRVLAEGKSVDRDTGDVSACVGARLLY